MTLIVKIPKKSRAILTYNLIIVLYNNSIGNVYHPVLTVKTVAFSYQQIFTY
jgi:hypothetical protein